jgi:PAS domain S-box-containing protein
LGAPGPVVWSEIWDVVGPMANRVKEEGNSNWVEDQVLYMNRRGYTEETYFTFSYSPVLDLDGKIRGVFCACTETTDKVFTNRQLKESEIRFRNLADESPMFVFIIEAGPLAPVSYWNQTWLSYTGQTQEEALGRAWDGIIHPEDVAVVMQHYTPAFENRQAYFVPAVRVKRHDGIYRWHAFKGNPCYLSTGQFNGFVGVGFDIHDQKLAEDALKESEARTRAAIDIARLGTFEINVQQQTIIHSPRNAEILGLDPAKQWSYQSVVDTVHPEDGHIRSKAHEEAKQTGELFYEARVIHPDQSIRWVRINGRYIYQNNHPVIIGTLMDITAEKKAAEVLEQKVAERTAELQVAVEELKHSNQNLESFAYAASHDLKEPVRKIHTFSNRLKDSLGERLTDSEKHYFERMELASKRMGSLIDDLLLYSEVSQTGGLQESVGLNFIIDCVLSDLDLDIEQKGATVRVDRLFMAKGHPRQLQQAFHNLIGNALKYGKPGVPPLIHISCRKLHADEVIPVTTARPNDKYNLIEIRDNGIGFEPEDADRIFNVFTRLHGNAEFKGTGIGLSIVRRVIESHNGHIWAESQPGAGAAFKMLLPIS